MGNKKPIKVVVLGDTGCLGWIVKKRLEIYGEGLKIYGVSRKDGLLIHPSHNTASLLNKIPCLHSPDYIINCIGAIKPVFNDKNRLAEAIYTNAIFPHELVEWNNRFEVGARIISVTTDCVFLGADGGYTELSPHDCTDEYGKSKSLGEPEDCMVIRTSIVGPEIGGNKRSLVEWVLSQRGKEINGYSNHMWNGVTTLELAELIGDIIYRDLYSEGTKHIYSTDVSKFELLSIMNEEWELGMKINKVDAPTYCNRTMRTVHKLNSLLAPMNMRDMIKSLTPYINAAN